MPFNLDNMDKLENVDASVLVNYPMITLAA